MHLSVFSSLISTFLTIHAMLYHPVFPPLPERMYAPVESSALVLSMKKPNWVAAPAVRATGAIVIDQKSAEVLFEKNADEKLAPASTTKIMTALLALENYDLSTQASVSANLAHDGSSMGLTTGEHILIRDLIAGLLIPSANDAADQLSRLYPGGTPAFVARMNSRAHELGLRNTHYVNPIGYEDPEQYTSVRDLSILAREAMQHPEFAEFVQIKSTTVFNTDGRIPHALRSTNELLGTFEGIQGIKTGWTEEAGECLVAQATRGEQTLISVVLHSPDRFGETRSLLNWAFLNYVVESVPVTE